MGKKYRTEEEKDGLLRIIALKDFSDVKKGDKGGLIRDEINLSQEGNCWVYEKAMVSDCARVSGDAKVSGNARVWGWARVYENAQVSGNAVIYGCAEVFGNAKVCGYIVNKAYTKISGNVKLWSTARSDIYASSIENYTNYTVFGTRDGFIIVSSNAEDVGYYYNDITIENYIENIKTIRQLYGKEI